jgi:hypothetical protein
LPAPAARPASIISIPIIIAAVASPITVAAPRIVTALRGNERGQSKQDEQHGD